MLLEHLKRGQPVHGNIHLVAEIPEKVAHKMPRNGIVVDHQHSHNRSTSFIRILRGSTARETAIAGGPTLESSRLGAGHQRGAGSATCSQ
jgi:hypothetical protein